MSQEGLDSEGLQMDVSYFVLPLRVNVGYLCIVELLILGVDCCKLLNASYGRPKCRVMSRQCSVIGALVPRPSCIN